MGEVVDVEQKNKLGGEKSIILNPMLLPVISDLVSEYDYSLMADGNALAFPDGEQGLFMIYLATPSHGICNLRLDISNLAPILIGKGDLSILLDTHARYAIQFYGECPPEKRNPKLDDDILAKADKAAFTKIIEHRISIPRYVSNLALVGEHIDYIARNKTIKGASLFSPNTRDLFIEKLCSASDITRLDLNNRVINFPFIKSMFKEIPFLSKEILGSAEQEITIHFLRDLRLAITGLSQTPNPELNILFGRDSSDDDRTEAAARLKIILKKTILDTIKDYYVRALLYLEIFEDKEVTFDSDDMKEAYPEQFEAVTAAANQINSFYERFISNKEPIENYIKMLKKQEA